MISSRNRMAVRRPGVWTIGSGKGGVGKSFLTASMAVMLARAGKSVIVADADLSGPNLHAYLGIKAPEVTLLDVLERRSALSDALLPTSEPHMRFVSCVGEEPGMADLNPEEQAAIAEMLLSVEADHVLIDAGSGTSGSVLDFFNLGTEAIVVAAPDQISLQSAYGFIRNSIYRRLQQAHGSHPTVSAALRQMRQGAHPAQAPTMSEFYDRVRQEAKGLAESIAAMVNAYRPLLLVNLAVSDQDQRKAEIIQSAAKKFLDVNLRLCGLIPFDAAVSRSLRRTGGMDGGASDCLSARQIRQMALRLAGHDPRGDEGKESRPRSPVAGTPATGLNDSLVFMGRDLHVQTEDMGNAGHCITTQVFCEGRVILSTKSAYSSSRQDLQSASQVVELMRAQHFNVIREIENRMTRIESAQA
jgi:flagellar biosynthesis protein FlhG